jgi:hypothetical protein
MEETKHTSFYNYTVAFFLYAALFVDLYRKRVGVSVGTVRNVIYITCLLFVLWDAYKNKRLSHMLLLGGVMSLLYFFSSVIYPGYNQIYISAWMMFISRLWPAYYIGRYTEDWNGVSCCVRKFIWIALLYALLAFTAEVSEATGAMASYATIATNLFFVVWIAFYDSYHNHKVVSFILCLVCFLPVLFLGTRACSIGALLALVLYLFRVIQKSDLQRKIFYYVLLFAATIAIIVFFTSLSGFLLDLFPNSRTLGYLAKGEILDDSNRGEGVYLGLVESLKEHPLKIYGLVGNQIFNAGPNASFDEILASFAHNVYLELCMNFGLIIGVFLGVYFTIVLIYAYLKSKTRDRAIEYVFLGVFGMTFVNMMVSFSWLFQYEVWLLVGLAYNIIRTRLDTDSTVSD